MKRFKRVFAFIAVFCLLMITLSGCGSDSDAVIKALREGNDEEANDLYFDKIQADEKAEAKFSEAYTAELKKVYAELNDGKITYDEANALVENFEKFRNSEAFEELTGQVTRLAASKELFEYAEDYMTREEYPAAISCYDGILPDDTNYDTAQQRRSEAYDDFLSAELEKAEAYAAGGNYSRAIETLLSDIDLYPEETEFSDALLNTKRGYVNSVLDDAAARFIANQDYIGAMAAIKAVDGLIGDEELEALLERGYEYYQSFEPVSLAARDSIYDDGELKQSKNGKITDNYGQTYAGYLYFTSEGFWAKNEYTGSSTFDVTDYDKLKCRLILINSAKNTENGGSLNLYLDGDLVYQSLTVRKGTEPIDIELDLSEFTQLRIEMVYHTYSSIQLVDSYISKDAVLAEPFSERA